MSSVPGVIPTIFLFSVMAKTETKFFLAKTETFPTNKRSTGEDYGIGPAGGFFIIDNCNTQCDVTCTEDKSVSFNFGIKSYRCFSSSPKLKMKPKEPTTMKPETTTVQEGCARSPRNHGRNSRIQKRRKILRKQEEPWGFFVTTARSVAGKSFCCSRGPRSGELVIYQGGCKPKSPRKKTG